MDDLASSVVRHRWFRCLLLHSVLSSFLWILFPFFSLSFFRFSLFLYSQLLFGLGQVLVVRPESNDMASFRDILKFLWSVPASGTGLKGDGDSAELKRKIRNSADGLLFGFLCVASGLIGTVASSGLPVLEGAPRGAALGALYSVAFYRKKRTVLAFPVIQRQSFFSLKMGLPEAARTTARFSVAAIPFTELVNSLLNWSEWPSYLPISRVAAGRVVSFSLSSIFICFCWELCGHLVQVMNTRRHKFAPPLGSSAAETAPNELLIVALEETEKNSIAHYLAFQDLCIVAESNVDAWRRASLFEETGEVYQRIIKACLRPIDMLTIRLSGGVEALTNGEKYFQKQIQSFKKDMRVNNAGIDKMFRDFQLCSWCVRIAAALTACSKTQDRYGVAQLKGCHAAVVSSLLSCLLVIEVALGRNAATPFNSTGPNNNSIKWTVPSRGSVEELGRGHKTSMNRQAFLHRRGYAMADVLCTSLYLIVSAFKSDISSPSVVETYWLSKDSPLYGSKEMHRVKLNLFINAKAS